MTRQRLKHYLQKHFDIENNRFLQAVRPLIKDKNLWHLNRYSFAAGIAIGIFSAWIPIPFHTIIAIFLALVFDCNVPLAVIAIWVANPFTMPEMYFFAYELGAKILDINTNLQSIDMSISGFLKLMNDIWEPLILGCLLAAIVTGLITYLILSILWAPIFARYFIHDKKKKKGKKK